MAKKGKRGNVVNIRGRKKTPAPSTKASGKPAAPPPSDDNVRASFLQHFNAWNGVQAKLKAAKKLEKDMVASAKADGFLKKEFEVAEALAGSPKKEARIVGEVSLRQRVARWIGHPMGAQLDLFEKNKGAIVDPRDEGKQHCMEGGRASPPAKYAPGSIPYTQWLEGYHAEQERKVKSGIKPLAGNGELDDGEPDGEGNPVAAVGADPARPLSDFDEPVSDAKH